MLVTGRYCFTYVNICTHTIIVRYYHPNGTTLNVDENYFKMRSSLVTSELLLVRALGFDLEVELPFAYCLNVLRGLGSIRYFRLDETKKTSKRHHHHHSHNAQKEVWKKMENGNISNVICWNMD